MAKVQETRTRDSDEYKMIDRLERAKRILDNAGIEFWLDWGTLLGAIRNRQFIPWDHDIDFGMWSTYRNARDSCIKEFIADGWKIYGHHPWNLKVRLEGFPPAGLDLYCYDKRDEKAYMIGLTSEAQLLNYVTQVLTAPNDYEADFQASGTLKGMLKIAIIRVSRVLPLSLRKVLAKLLMYFPNRMFDGRHHAVVSSSYFEDLSTIDFYEMKFYNPNRAEEYLMHRYGKDWQIPKKVSTPRVYDSS